MSRIVVRRAPEDAAHPRRFSISSALIGLAVGGGVALLVHQVWKAATEEGWEPGRPLPRDRSTAPIGAAREVLAADLVLRERELDLLPGARGAIELHGWVENRAERARAARLVRDAIAPVALVNALLVHGEDDGESAEDETTADLASA